MLLQIEKLHKHFGKRPVLQDINMHLATGEFVCVLGASGSGKSTLLRQIAGLDQPTCGTIRMGGKTITGPGPDRGMVFQQYTLYPWMTVQENTEFGLKLQGVPKKLRREQASYYLKVVGLSEFAHALPKELSGGMKQRVAIARALASEPKLLLMDEPFGALDVHTREHMHEFMLDLWQRTQLTVLMITHDVDEAIFLANRIYVLSSNPGRIRQELQIDLPRRTLSVKRSHIFQDYREELMQLLRHPKPYLLQAA